MNPTRTSARTAVATVSGGLAALLGLAACATSSVDASAPTVDAVVQYVDYSAYPRSHHLWGGMDMRIQLGRKEFSLNDVGERFELLSKSGWQVFNSRIIVLAVPGSPDAPGTLEAEGLRFTRQEKREMALFGIRVDAEEIRVEELKTGKHLGYVHFSQDRGVVAISFSEGPSHWMMYVLSGRCGLFASVTCAKGDDQGRE